MKDTLRDDCDDDINCVKNCCVSHVFAPIFFVIFVLMAQFVLVNVVVAVLMKHLEESHKQIDEDYDMDREIYGKEFCECIQETTAKPDDKKVGKIVFGKSNKPTPNIFVFLFYRNQTHKQIKNCSQVLNVRQS